MSIIIIIHYYIIIFAVKPIDISILILFKLSTRIQDVFCNTIDLNIYCSEICRPIIIKPAIIKPHTVHKIGTSRRRRQRHLVNGIEASHWSWNQFNSDGQ